MRRDDEIAVLRTEGSVGSHNTTNTTSDPSTPQCLQCDQHGWYNGCEILCPINCSVSSWTNWTGCSQFCATGFQNRTRSILVSALGTGTACPAASGLVESRDCEDVACDCTFTNWTA